MTCWLPRCKGCHGNGQSVRLCGTLLHRFTTLKSYKKTIMIDHVSASTHMKLVSNSTHNLGETPWYCVQQPYAGLWMNTRQLVLSTLTHLTKGFIVEPGLSKIESSLCPLSCNRATSTPAAPQGPKTARAGDTVTPSHSPGSRGKEYPSATTPQPSRRFHRDRNTAQSWFLGQFRDTRLSLSFAVHASCVLLLVYSSYRDCVLSGPWWL